MKDGLYRILFKSRKALPGEEIGSFILEDGSISDCRGLAEEVLESGPLTAQKKAQILRLNNGYNWVVREPLPVFMKTNS